MLEAIRTYDRSALTALNGWATSSLWATDITYFFAHYAILIFGLAVLYLFYKKRFRAVIVCFSAVAVAVFIDYIVTLIRYRNRPFIVHTDVVKLDNINSLLSSFPSTHSVIVFAVATAITLYGHRRLGPALYVLAIIIAISRVAAGVHYPSDVIAGAIIGSLAGMVSYQFVEYALEEHHEIENTQK